NNYDLVIFGYQRINSKGKLSNVKKYTNKQFDGHYIRNNYHLFFDMHFKYGIQGPPWNKVFDLNIIKENKIEYPPLRRHQDEVFISRYVKHVQRVCFISEVLYTHFLNDTKDKWNKFPITYVDIVDELYKYRLKTVGEFNKSNKKLQGLIYVEYIYNTIKAFDLIFNPNLNLSKDEKIKWIKRKSQEIFINEELVKVSKYNSKIKVNQILIFLKLIKNKDYKKVYKFLYLRYLLETRLKWALSLLKKYRP